jgi:tRNA A-37 threonylcarbamoyl transferase component Bud32
MTKWEDERAQTMLSGPQAGPKRVENPPLDPAAGGTWAAASAPALDSNDPTSPVMVSSSRQIYLAPGTCPDENLLVELAEGKLAGSARSTIERHLDTCPECSRLVIELAKLAAPAKNAPKRYNIIRQLGAGAMGVVWEAEDTHLHRKVALKFVKADGTDDKALRKRLLREARALAQVRHPNVMAVYDAGEADDEVCLVLELVVGSNARVWRNAKPRAIPEILAVWRQAAAGIAAVHRAGIVHRDIKPDNVFVADDNRVLVGDFGLARGNAMDTTTSLTVSGAVIGTPLYMSPEQLHGATATQKSDQFALCASIWEALLDERPFRGTTIAAIVLAMQKVPEVPKTATPEQRRLLVILQKGLDPDPTKRFENIDALIAALEPPKAKNRASLYIGIAAVGLAVGGTIAVLGATRGQKEAPPANPGSATTGSATGSPGSAGSATGSPATGADVTTGSATINAGSAGVGNSGLSGAGSGGSAGSGTSGFGTGGSAGRGSAASGFATVGAGSAAKPPKLGIKSDGKLDAKGQLARDTTPVEVPNPDKPAGTGPIAALPTDYTTIMTRAADRLNFGDGAGCLKLLANLPELPDDEMRRIELVKSNCRMATGDCAGAAAAIEATGKRLGWEVGQIKTTIETSDKLYCPIDAPPQARWAERAQYRLQLAAGVGRSCKAVLDVIAKHNIALPDQKSVPFLEIQCAVNVGDCAKAKARYLAWLMPKNPDPDQIANLEATHTKGFHDQFKKLCPAP